MWPVPEVIQMCRDVDRMARRVGHRFVPDKYRLRELGYSFDEIAAIYLNLAQDDHN